MTTMTNTNATETEPTFDTAYDAAMNAQFEIDLRDHYLGAVAEDECPMCLADAPDDSELSSPAGLASHAPEPSQFGAHGSKTVEQLRIETLKAELAIEEEKVREQAREVKRQEQETERQVKLAAQQVKSAALVEKVRAWVVDLVAAMNAEGVHCIVREGQVGEWSPTLPGVTFADQSLGYKFPVHFEERFTGGRYSRRSAGYKVVIGQSGETKSFPQLAKGGFSYEKIAKEVASRISSSQREASREAERHAEQIKAKQTLEYVAKVLGGLIVDGAYNYKGRYESRTPVLTMSAETAQKLYERLGEFEVKASLYDARLADEQSEVQEAVN